MKLIDVFNRILVIEKNINLRKNFLDRAFSVLTLKKELFKKIYYHLDKNIKYQDIIKIDYRATNQRINENGLLEYFIITVEYKNTHVFDRLEICANHALNICIFTLNGDRVDFEIESLKSIFSRLLKNTKRNSQKYDS